MTTGKSRKKYRIEIRGSSVFIRTYSKSSTTVLVISDVHSPFYDVHAIEMALRIMSDVCPDIVILNGDIVDFMGISKYPVPPARRIGFYREIEDGIRLLEYLRNRCKTADVFYLEGNHEERLKRYLWGKAPELAELSELSVARLLRLEEHGIKYIEAPATFSSFDDYVAAQVVINDRLYITHGHSIRSAGNLVNVARTVYHKVLVPMLIGHWHRVQHHEETSYDGKTQGVWVSGCLCYPRPSYDAGRIWGQGICVVHVKGEWFRPTLVSYFRQGNALHAIYNGVLYTVDLTRQPRVPLPSF